MSLDPVHFDGIAGLADRIDYDAEDRDHRDFADTVWSDYLDPLRHDGEKIIEPIEDLSRRMVPISDAGLAETPFETTHGLDAGTLNPRVFKNGLVLDVAHAAMSASPSDLPLHDRRTVVKAVHSNDATATFGTEWETYGDAITAAAAEGSEQPRSNRRIVHTTLPESKYEEDVVHGLALYLAESQHALDNADAVSDILLLDGPVFPKGILRWYYRSSELTDLFAESDHVSRILDNYVALVETFVERDVPLAGFVKNVAAKSVIRALKATPSVGSVPWAHDAGFFSQVLERGEYDRDGRFERDTDHLTLTNWFVSTAGADGFFSKTDNRHLDRDLDPDQYRVTFCMVYDPRRDLIYRLEAPFAVTTDEDARHAIEQQVLTEIAVRQGPPRAISKADELARIDRGSVDSLITSFERSLDTELDENYDAVRWGRGY